MKYTGQKMVIRIVFIIISLLCTGINPFVLNLSAAISSDIYCTVTIVKTPPVPTNFEEIAISTSSIQWSWDNVINEDGYRIYTATDGFKVETSTDVTTWLETGLIPNTAYSRHVRAFNTAGEKPCRL